MTHTEKEEIKAHRVAGQSYAAIADALGLRKDQVSAFCRRYIQKDICLNCGKPLTQIKGRKPIKFCNAVCRTGWWNSHPSAVHQKAYYNFICKCCGKEFMAYGNTKRKYCSHVCYIQDRFSKWTAISGKHSLFPLHVQKGHSQRGGMHHNWYKTLRKISPIFGYVIFSRSLDFLADRR